MREMITRNFSAATPDFRSTKSGCSAQSVVITDAPPAIDAISDKVPPPSPTTEQSISSSISRGNGQKILKSIHPPKNQPAASHGEKSCYVPVTDDEFDTLQRKYGELTGEIVIVEITTKQILEILTANLSKSGVASNTGPLHRASLVAPVTSFQRPSIQSSQKLFKSLGIFLCGNKDLNQMAVLVCGLRPGGIAEVDGRIAVGDQLLELNEHILYGRSHLNAGPLIRSCLLNVLHKSSSRRSKNATSLCFVICRNPENLANMAVAPLTYSTKDNQSTTSESRSEVSSASQRSLSQMRGSLIGRSTFEEIHATHLLRGRNGFGFAIMDKSFTNEPGIYIKQLVENSPAALDGTLRAGDRILRVDWHDAVHASYDSVLEWLRSARYQVRIVVSRVRLFTGENQPPDDEEIDKIGFRKRLSAPLISSLIHAFMHPSTSKKPSFQSTSPEDTAGSSSDDHQTLQPSKRIGSANCDYAVPSLSSSKELRRASCPDAVIPGFAKRMNNKNILCVVPMTSLTQLAGPPLPVMPLSSRTLPGGAGTSIGGSGEPNAKCRRSYEVALQRFAASCRSPPTRGRDKRNGMLDRDEAESALTRPIQPGKKTLIGVRRNAETSLGISLIGGCETSLGVVQVHEIFPEGAAAKDGRLRPGDRLLAVNNASLTNLPYSLAVSTIVAAFSGHAPLESQMDLSKVVAATSSLNSRHDDGSGSGGGGCIFLLVERRGKCVQTKWYDLEVTVELAKKPGRGLGLCIVERAGPAEATDSEKKTVTPSTSSKADGDAVSAVMDPKGSPVAQNGNKVTVKAPETSKLGVIVCDLIKGSTAQVDGRIMIGDQILSVNDFDVECSSQEIVATLLKTAQGTVTLRLGRLKNQPMPLNSVTVAFNSEQ